MCGGGAQRDMKERRTSIFCESCLFLITLKEPDVSFGSFLTCDCVAVHPAAWFSLVDHLRRTSEVGRTLTVQVHNFLYVSSIARLCQSWCVGAVISTSCTQTMVGGECHMEIWYIVEPFRAWKPPAPDRSAVCCC